MSVTAYQIARHCFDAIPDEVEAGIRAFEYHVSACVDIDYMAFEIAKNGEGFDINIFNFTSEDEQSAVEINDFVTNPEDAYRIFAKYIGYIEVDDE